MHLFVHDRTASNVLMKAMKAWVEKRRAQPAGVEPAAIDAFDAWVRERDTLASVRRQSRPQLAGLEVDAA